MPSESAVGSISIITSRLPNITVFPHSLACQEVEARITQKTVEIFPARQACGVASAQHPAASSNDRRRAYAKPHIGAIVTGHMSAFAATPPRSGPTPTIGSTSSCARCAHIPNKASAQPSGFSGS